MNFTLHLTKQCNLDCTYCTAEKTAARMSEDVLYAACDLAFSKGKTAGLCFFGGEPLLERELIFKALEYCQLKAKATGKQFQCKMTTNGTLLDRAFLARAKKAGMGIGMSFDGTAQDLCRRYANGSPTQADMERSARLLLDALPDSYAMLTLAPQAVSRYAESVRYLHALGFRRVTATIAYGGRVHWTDDDLLALEEQLRQLTVFYTECFLSGKPFYFSPFDAKIRECITGYNPAERCHLGYRQMPVAVDGRIYPCTQFIGDADYCLGDVFHGIDTDKQLALSRRNALPEECAECDLKRRCTNSCGCLNRLETGDETKVSPLQCSYERMLIGICDALAERLFQEHPARFQKWFIR